MELVYKRPEALLEQPSPFCPGCFHALVLKVMAEVIDEMGIREKMVYGACIGCSAMAPRMCNYDHIISQHGRNAAACTAFKAINPDSVIVCYQGDGDVAAIGTAESIHAARRGAPITVIAANNTLYGMTGGQMAPTTMIGQKVTTAPDGSTIPPIHMAEMIAGLDGPDYVARCSVYNPKRIKEFKKSLRHAFECQMAGKYSFIEVLCACPTNGGYKPSNGPKFVKERMEKVYPLGELKVDGKLV